uniref:RING-type domain-containing protein n=1 Tax=Panagrolaimus davidi TaxID=227884 RepID=A0A914QRZ4_9BILA
MASPKLSFDKIKSPKIVAVREKKLLTSPYTRPISSSRKYKEISRPLYSIVSDELTVEYICFICLDNLQPNNTSFTSCGHICHQNCLKLWYKNYKHCPLCRNDDIFDNALLPILPQPNEEKHEDFALFNDFENLQQCVMTSIFEMWPICNLSKRHPKQ